jgi:hypothetical protein
MPSTEQVVIDPPEALFKFPAPLAATPISDELGG